MLTFDLAERRNGLFAFFYSYRTPKIGDSTNTHFHDVVLRKGPSTKSRKIILLPAFQTVNVIGVGKSYEVYGGLIASPVMLLSFSCDWPMC